MVIFSDRWGDVIVDKNRLGQDRKKRKQQSQQQQTGPMDFFEIVMMRESVMSRKMDLIHHEM